MSGTRQSSPINIAERVADTQGIADDLDAIREVNTDGNGTAVRVLLEDAADEADQVGFQTSKPPGTVGQNMFRKRLKQGMRELKNIRDGTQTNSGERAEESVETEAPTDTEDVVRTEDQASTDVVSDNAQQSLEVGVTLTDDSLSELTDALDETTAAMPSAERVDEIESRLDTIEDRLDDVEERFSMLASIIDPDEE